MKKTILALTVALCLLLQAVPGYASGLVFSPVTPEPSVSTGPFSDDDIDAVIDRLKQIDAGTPDAAHGGAAEKIRIVPFLDLSWEELQANPIACKKQYPSECVSGNGIAYTVEMNDLLPDIVHGSIRVKDDDRDLLIGLWNELGVELLAQYGSTDSMDELREGVQASYLFVDEKTSVCYEFVDYGAYYGISFILALLPVK